MNEHSDQAHICLFKYMIRNIYYTEAYYVDGYCIAYKLSRFESDIWPATSSHPLSMYIYFVDTTLHSLSPRATTSIYSCSFLTLT